ncbi:MAG: hypothetical protein ACLP56_19660, partial [Candidatus Sulfotelmatobacter sp.]
FACAKHCLRSGRQFSGIAGMTTTKVGSCVLACALSIAMAAAAFGQAAGQEKTADDGLVIEPTEMPQTYPHGPYQVVFHARGDYVPVLHWRVESGALPPGIKLEDNGVLHGEAERAGEFQFVVSVKDGGQPQQAVQRGFTIKVVEAITLAWKVPAHVNVSRIEGSVEVSNTTADDIDLTFDVKAVAENGRATEIGYQHFALKKGTVAMALPFGETLPHGAYVVYVNVNGEVARRNTIYTERMQTPGPLQVVPGP